MGGVRRKQLRVSGRGESDYSMMNFRKSRLRISAVFVVAFSLNSQLASVGIADDVSAQFTIDAMSCQQTSDAPDAGESARDEIYLIVIGKTSLSTHVVKFPSFDDTYAFTDRTVADGRWVSAANGMALPSPLLWRGALTVGDFASFVVLIGEQDDDDTSVWPETVGELFERVANEYGGDRLREEDIAAVESTLRDIVLNFSSELEFEKNDKVVGIFGVSIINNENQFVINFSSIKDTNIIQKKSSGYGKIYIETENDFGAKYGIIPAVSVK